MGCRDVCGTKRLEEEIATLSMKDAALLLQRNTWAVNTIHYLLVIVFVLWLLATGIPGFNLYDGVPGSTNAYTHSMWWLVIQFVVVLMGQSALKFNLHYVSGKGIEKGIGDTIITVSWYQTFLVLGVVAHVFHIVFMGLEAHSCSSTLCNVYSWAFWTTLALLCVHPFLQLWQVYRVSVYKANLIAATKLGRIDYDVIDDSNDEEEGILPSNSMITTPALRKFREKKKTRHHGFALKTK